MLFPRVMQSDTFTTAEPLAARLRHLKSCDSTVEINFEAGRQSFEAGGCDFEEPIFASIS